MVGLAKLAFIGLGQMGLPICRNLVAAGYVVTGFDTSETALKAFSSDGGIAAGSAVEAVSVPMSWPPCCPMEKSFTMS